MCHLKLNHARLALSLAEMARQIIIDLNAIETPEFASVLGLLGRSLLAVRQPVKATVRLEEAIELRGRLGLPRNPEEDDALDMVRMRSAAVLFCFFFFRSHSSSRLARAQCRP